MRSAERVPVRVAGGCDNWNIFVFIADHDHVIFHHAEHHNGETVASLLRGHRGYLLGDASAIYDVLYREWGITELGCWSHGRRYAWRALGTDRERALEALSLIGKLFEIDAQCKSIALPERTHVRAARAAPLLDAIDDWIVRTKPNVTPREPLATAIGYLTNQRKALRRFLEDGSLPIHNNGSEQQLRAVALGRNNWNYFANETGLKLYCTFRSLIASCKLHGLNPQRYLEQMLRLAPHWSVTRMLELAPKYWIRTFEALDSRYRAIVTAPWETSAPSARLTIDSPRIVVAAA